METSAYKKQFDYKTRSQFIFRDDYNDNHVLKLKYKRILKRENKTVDCIT